MAADVTITADKPTVNNLAIANVTEYDSVSVVPTESTRIDVITGVQQFGSPRPSSGFIYPRGLD